MTFRLPLRLVHGCSFVSVLLLGPAFLLGSSLLTGAAGLPSNQENGDTDLVRHALATELASVQDTQHPMRYTLRKSSPRYASAKQIVETKDGAVARLVAVNDKPLSTSDEQKEQARLNGLLTDPGKQRHRKQSEDDDLNRVVKVIRALPDAFLYEHIGPGDGPHGKVEKFSFKPNPAFDPQDLETHALTAMTGEIWIDPTEDRVVRLEGRLQQDVDFGWGILGRLDKGGWIVLEQGEVADHAWRIVHFQMAMNGRLLFRSKSFDTTEDESNFTPVPPGTGYVQAIHMLRDTTNPQ